MPEKSKDRSGWLAHKKMMLLSALEENGWNRTRAARSLGISARCVTNLIRQMRAAGVEIPDAPKGRPQTEIV